MRIALRQRKPRFVPGGVRVEVGSFVSRHRVFRAQGDDWWFRTAVSRMYEWSGSTLPFTRVPYLFDPQPYSAEWEEEVHKFLRLSSSRHPNFRELLPKVVIIASFEGAV